MGFSNYDNIQFAKADQTPGTVGVVRFLCETESGNHSDFFPDITTNDTDFANSGAFYTDMVPQAIQKSGNMTGLFDPDGVGAIYAALFGASSVTDLTGAYQHDWTSAGSGLPVVIESNYSEAATSTGQLYRAMINNFSMTGEQGSETGGKMRVTLGYQAGFAKPGVANPVLGTIDEQDCFALGKVTNRVTIINLLLGGVTISLQDYTQSLTYNIDRTVENAPSSLTGGIVSGSAMQGAIPKFTCDVPLNVLSNGGSASQPDWGAILGFAYGSATAVIPAAFGPSKTVTATVSTFGQVTASAGNYFEHTWEGSAILEPSIDINGYTAGMKIKFDKFPTTVKIVNETLIYAAST